MKTKLTLLLVVAVIGVSQTALTQRGTLDNTFGINGKVVTDFGQYFYRSSVAIQRDGKIVVAGISGYSPKHLVMSRYLQNGIIDSSFGLNGIVDDLVTAGGSAAELVIQPDGKLVAVAGINTLARYLKDGRPDSTFGVNGKVITLLYVHSVAIQSDKKIVVGGGYSKFVLMRYNPDGTPDSSFGSNGVVSTQFERYAGIYSLAIQADGKIVAAGQGVGPGSYQRRFQYFTLARYKRDGKRDQTFGDNGKVQTGFADAQSMARGVVIQSDGQIVAAGTNCSHFRGGVVKRGNFALAQYKPDGTLHSTFGEEGNGRVITDVNHNDAAYSIALQANRKIIVVGVSKGNFALARYSGNGVPDSTFGNRNNGNAVTTDFGGDDNAYSVAIQEDGKIVVAGSSDGRLAIARYNSDITSLTDNSNDGIANLRKADNIVSSNIYLYPNPVKDILRIRGLSSSQKTITVIDAGGRALQKITTAGNDHTFNVGQLQPGIYYVRINDGKKITTLKFIKE